jgi:CheY-like chemotaxis protein
LAYLCNYLLDNLTEGQPVRQPNTPMTLLVVDDDEKIREVCRTVAPNSGMKAIDVSTAEEALELLEFSP